MRNSFPRPSPNRVLIRPATPADIAAIRALEQHSDTAAHWSEREYAALFAPETLQRFALVAEENGWVCAFAIARCATTEWEIENLVVATSHRRRGIAQALLHKLLQDFYQSAATSVLLEVRQSNHAAQQLYKQLGFIETGRRTGYYKQPPEDALLLTFRRQFLPEPLEPE